MYIKVLKNINFMEFINKNRLHQKFIHVYELQTDYRCLQVKDNGITVYIKMKANHRLAINCTTLNSQSHVPILINNSP